MRTQDDMLRKYAILCDQVANEEHLSMMEKMRGIFYRTKTIKSGTLLEVEAYPLLPRAASKAVRRMEVSKEAIAAHNQIAAEKRIVRLVETNFTGKDWYFTATIEGDKLPTLDEMQKMVGNFIGRINYRRKKLGLGNAKYIYVIEGYEEGSRQKRLHFHMIIDGGLSRETLREIWGRGRTKCDELDPKSYNGLINLAKYMVKDPRGRKRWVPSKNLKQPIVTIADRKIRSSAARRIAQSTAEAAAALEKIYPGYEHVGTEVKTNPYIPGCYIYAVMRKKDDGDKKTKGGKRDEQGNSDRKGGRGARVPADGKRSSGNKIPDGGQPAVQKRPRKP